jgi:serine/threonine-protein kinase
MSDVQPLSPAGLEHVIRTCLAKDPDKRWQSAGDVARELEWVSGTSSGAGLPISVSRTPRRQPVVWGLAGVAVGIIAAAGAASIFLAPPALPQHVARFAIKFSEPETWVPVGLALSPDGSRLAYVATSENGQRLYLRRIDQLEATPLQGTEGAAEPFFSPDGRWVGFATENKLQKVSVEGGLPLTLCDSPPVRGASWGDDVIVFGTTNTMEEGLLEVPVGGGKAQVLTRLNLDEGEFSHRWPNILPGGKGVVFTIRKSRGDSVAVFSRETGEFRTVIEDGLQGRYVSTGHLVYAQAGQLLAVPFDLDRLEVSGDPVPLIEDSSNQQFSVSEDGTLVYPSGAIALQPETQLLWVDRHGSSRPITDTPGRYSESRLSPDGRRLVFTILRENFDFDIWVLELGRGTITRLTFGKGNDSVPIWTPDGKQVTFSSDRSGRWNAFSVPADGSGEPVQLTNSPYLTTAASWSPDGKVLAVQQLRPGNGIDIGLLRPEQGGEPEILIGTPFNEAQPIFSPDGHWLAYTSDESGREEVYVRAFPGSGGKWQISTEGGRNPLWARNGRELFYRNGNKVMAVAVSSAGEELSPSAPTLLFEEPYLMRAFDVQELLNYDAGLDGREFVMMRTVEGESAPPTELHVVLNWFEELKARVPTK